MGETQLDDKRSGLRKPAIHGASVRYEMVEFNGEERSHSSELKDYSQLGLKVISYDPIPIGQILQLNVCLEPNGRPYRLTGEICWCLEVDQIPTYFAGVSLVDDESEDMECWQKLFE